MEPVNIPAGDLCKEAQKLKLPKEFVDGCRPNVPLFNQNDDRKASTICIKFDSAYGC